MTNFPTSLPSFTITGTGDYLSAAGSIGLSPLLNLFETEITAIATKIGTGSATPAAGKVLRASGTGTSTWGAVNLTSDVTGVLPVANYATGTPTGAKFVRDDGVLATPAGTGDALTSNSLAQFASTTSLQLLGVMSDETGTGALVFANTPTLVTPVLGVATATSINKYTFTQPATVATLTIANNKTLTISNTLTFTGTDGQSFAFPAASDTVAGLATAQTLSATRINPRITTTASAATVTPNADTDDVITITAQAAGLTIANETGTPVQGQKLIIRIKDNATAQTIAFGTRYRALGNPLPTTTVLSKTLYMGFIYNSTDTKWDLVALAQET